ncbi:MAG TPA: hypothetical protein PKX78_02135, partial [Candidatus Woesebacteria bacterium]|nr:hypothetical protein [Candidatus Woesebacteria bacterium]
KEVLDAAVEKVFGEQAEPVVESVVPAAEKPLSKWGQGEQWVENSGVKFVDEEAKTIAMDFVKDVLVAEERLGVELQLDTQEQAEKVIEVSNDTWAKFQESKDFSQMSPVRQLMMRLNIGTGDGGVLNTDLTTADLEAINKVIEGMPVDDIKIEGASALDRYGQEVNNQGTGHRFPALDLLGRVVDKQNEAYQQEVEMAA